MAKNAKRKQKQVSGPLVQPHIPPQIPGQFVGGAPFPSAPWNTGLGKAVDNFLTYSSNHLQAINNSKIFAGLMIILLNIASRFVQINLSKTMEAYLKYTFSKQILVFAITWVGTRDILIAFVVTIIFIICSEYLFNENSSLCCLPESFTTYHVSLLDNVSDDEIRKAEEVLEKAKAQDKVLQWEKVKEKNRDSRL
jgi:hypothetical protein